MNELRLRTVEIDKIKELVEAYVEDRVSSHLIIERNSGNISFEDALEIPAESRSELYEFLENL